MTKSVSIYHHMVRGAAWAILMRWSRRLIGVVSMVILARLLSPEDFGIVAMGSITLALFSSFTEFGISQQIIRKQNITDEDCNTGWTLQLLQHLLIAMIVSALAHPISSFFNEPRLVPVIWILSVGFAIRGLQNIGMVLARKELDFARDFRFNVYTKVTRFLAVVPLAFILGTYWAIVIGQLVNQVIAIVISFRMHAYRPRLSLARWRDFVALGVYLIPIHVARFLRGKTHIVFVGRIAGTSTLGAYNLASDIASMPTQEIAFPIGRALAPSYARLLDDRDALREACLNVIGAIARFAIPVAIGLCMIASEVVLVVLGEKWRIAIPFIQWLAVYASLNTMSRNMTGNVLITTGNERMSALAEWIGLGISLTCVLTGVWLGGVDGILMAITGGAALMVPISATILSRALDIRLAAIAIAIWPPLVAGALMAVALLPVVRIDGLPLVVKLGCELGVGVAAYVIALVGLWLVRGRPPGVEHAVLAVARARWLQRQD